MKKTEFNNLWKRATKTKDITNTGLINELDTLLKNAELYLGIVSLPHQYRTIGGRLNLCTPSNCIPLLKSKIQSKIFDSESSRRNRTLSTMRAMISPQIKSFRKKWYKKAYEFAEARVCPLSGKNLLTTEIAVDHKIPFIKLAEDFAKEQGINFSEVEVIGWGPKTKFKNPELCKKWKKYHKDNAILQVVDKDANLRASDRGYRKN